MNLSENIHKVAVGIQSRGVDCVTPGHVNQEKIFCQVIVSFEVSCPRRQRLSHLLRTFFLLLLKSWLLDTVFGLVQNVRNIRGRLLSSAKAWAQMPWLVMDNNNVFQQKSSDGLEKVEKAYSRMNCTQLVTQLNFSRWTCVSLELHAAVFCGCLDQRKVNVKILMNYPASTWSCYSKKDG